MRVAAIDVGTNWPRGSSSRMGQGDRSGLRRPPDDDHATRLRELERVEPRSWITRRSRTDSGYDRRVRLRVRGRRGADLRVTGTSAVQRCANRYEFFDGVKSLTGKDPDRTVRRGGSAGAHVPREPPLILARQRHANSSWISGEAPRSLVVRHPNREPARLSALDVGCVRMFEKYLHSDPPRPKTSWTRSEPRWRRPRGCGQELEVPAGTPLIGVAGTVAQLAVLKTGIPVYDPDVTHHAS